LQYGIEAFEKHDRTDRCLGGSSFIELAEKLLSRGLKKKKRGLKRKEDAKEAA